MPCGTGREEAPKTERVGIWTIAVSFLGFPLIISLFTGYWLVFLLPLGLMLVFLVCGLIQGLLAAPFVWLLYKLSKGNRTGSHK